jgi:hypothetical protein
MKKIYIVRSRRKSLIKDLVRHYKTSKKYKTIVINIPNIISLDKYLDSIKSGQVEYIVFSNGTDSIDRDIQKKIIELNPEQKFIFSENAWLTWQNYIYLDPMGIGNLSEIFTFTPKNIIDYVVHKDKILQSTRITNKLLDTGSKSPYTNYILVPLQVNNDSKLLIGSPFFKKVSEFISYMIDITPNDINLLFKNHPHNKNKFSIPKKQNVYDITMANYSKKTLIENSLYVAGINSTFLIESMFLDHRTVTYGLDIFSNKNIIIEGYNKSIEEIMNYTINTAVKNKFLEVLMSRQVNKT